MPAEMERRGLRQDSKDSSYSYESDRRQRERERETRQGRRQDSSESEHERRHRRRERERERERERRRRHRQDTLETVDGGESPPRERRRRHRQDTVDTVDSGRSRDDRPGEREKRERDREKDRDRRNRRERSPPITENPFANPFDSPPAYEDYPPYPHPQTYAQTKDRPVKKPSRSGSTEIEKPSNRSHHDEEKGQKGASTSEDTNPQTEDDRRLTKLERFGGPWIYIIPILAAYCLLAAATCSSDWWRKDVNIVKVGLPGDVYGRMLATGKNLGKSGGDEVPVTTTGGGGTSGTARGGVKGRAATVVPGGWLSVGFWGWCVSPEGDGSYACSETDAWYTMDELLETASVTTTIPPDAYFVGLIHGIVVHGLAMIAAMSASVPAGILIWRRYIRNNKAIQPGLALHGTMFAGATFSFISFVVDKTLEARLRDQIKYPVKQGSVPTLAGVAALLLFLALIASTAPGVYRRVKRQKEYAGSWEDVHVAECQPEPEPEESRSKGRGGGRGLKRSRTWKKMKRMTGFYGHREGGLKDDRDEYGYEDKREKRRKDRRRRNR